MKVKVKGSPLWMVIHKENGFVLYVATGSRHHARQKGRAILGTALTNEDLARMGYEARRVKSIKFMDDPDPSK